MGTWIEAEEACYPSGRQMRRGRALFADGKVRAFRAGIPDTYFTIPAHARIGGKYVAGFVTPMNNNGEDAEHTLHFVIPQNGGQS